jgi:hypothetical protein
MAWHLDRVYCARSEGGLMLGLRHAADRTEAPPEPRGASGLETRCVML